MRIIARKRPNDFAEKYPDIKNKTEYQDAVRLLDELIDIV